MRDLDAAPIQGRQWRDETRALLKGLGEAIDRQFSTWKLTEAERSVGLSCSPLGVLPRRPSCANRTRQLANGTCPLNLHSLRLRSWASAEVFLFVSTFSGRRS